MRVLLAQYAPKKSIPVWGTSNYILQIPSRASHKRVTQTPAVGGGMGESGANTMSPAGNQYYVPHPRSIRVDNIKANTAKSLARKLKHRGVRGGGIAVI